MKNTNFKNLDTEEKMLIVKALVDLAKGIYDDNKKYILRLIALMSCLLNWRKQPTTK